ncbi:hypothetical protein A7U60_g3288 [Sanghuangporus baumii]|uniref:Uncharacterized protein n=1 Tax=Sanghuangporus baumii TaxID=108892 RepID=A0A9Q5N9Z8_SANBA|nr:hypothetical protein A7U60_g3288 [Sanghuangporus baumii]
MGQFYDSCPQNLLDWIQRQHLFFVATAPLSPSGHVNVSPKGAYDCFHVIGPNKVWYEDLTGSGTVYEFGTPEYEELIPKEIRKPGSRSVIMIDIHKVGSSCGYSVPYYDFKGDRTQLLEYFQRVEAKTDPNSENPRSDKGMREYWATKNTQSIDGLPSVQCAPDSKETPTNAWSKEEERKKSEERVKLHRKQSYAAQDGDAIDAEKSAMVNANAGTRLVAAFAMGVFTTLLCIRVARTSV